MPFLVSRYYSRKAQRKKQEQRENELRDLLGLKRRKVQPAETEDATSREVEHQVDLLKKMYMNGAGNDPANNISFITNRTLDISTSTLHRFGMRKVYSNDQFLDKFFNEMQHIRSGDLSTV